MLNDDEHIVMLKDLIRVKKRNAIYEWIFIIEGIIFIVFLILLQYVFPICNIK